MWYTAGARGEGSAIALKTSSSMLVGLERRRVAEALRGELVRELVQQERDPRCYCTDDYRYRETDVEVRPTAESVYNIENRERDGNPKPRSHEVAKLSLMERIVVLIAAPR
ncbi:hypothetical protein [Haloarchaeobius iranensis]|uniref:hypothetical protein n=1 Tax=Haloarchaeobius iranensis TaxID=996166 RepID=UPI0036274D6D